MWSKCLALTVTVTVNNTIDLLLWTTTSMVHLWSQWWVKQTGGYLVVIVSEGVQLRLTRQVRSGLTGSVMTRYSLLVTRYSLLVTRYSSGVVSGKSGRVYHLYTLPLISLTYIHLTSDIWHSTFDIRHSTFDIRHSTLSILALAWQFQPPIRWSH